MCASGRDSGKGVIKCFKENFVPAGESTPFSSVWGCELALD